jgi:hypothetical protein
MSERLRVTAQAIEDRISRICAIRPENFEPSSQPE